MPSVPFGSLCWVSATAPEVAGHLWSDVVEPIEVETTFGTVAAGEQALADAIKELLRTASDCAGPDDLDEAPDA